METASDHCAILPHLVIMAGLAGLVSIHPLAAQPLSRELASISIVAASVARCESEGGRNVIAKRRR